MSIDQYNSGVLISMIFKGETEWEEQVVRGTLVVLRNAQQTNHITCIVLWGSRFIFCCHRLVVPNRFCCTRSEELVFHPLIITCDLFRFIWLCLFDREELSNPRGTAHDENRLLHALFAKRCKKVYNKQHASVQTRVFASTPQVDYIEEIDWSIRSVLTASIYVLDVTHRGHWR